MRKIKNICLVILALAAAYGLGAFITWFAFRGWTPWYCGGGVFLGAIPGLTGAHFCRKDDFVIEFGKTRIHASTIVVTLMGMVLALLIVGLLVLAERWWHYSDIVLIQNTSTAWGELFGAWFSSLMGFKIYRENDAKKKDTVEKSFASVKNE